MNKHKREVAEQVHVQAVPQLQPRHLQPPAIPPLQLQQGMIVTSPSIYSKQLPKLAAPAAQVGAPVVREGGEVLLTSQALVLEWEQQLEQALKAVQGWATSTSFVTTLSSSSYARSCRLSRVCLSLSCSRSALETQTWPE